MTHYKFTQNELQSMLNFFGFEKEHTLVINTKTMFGREWFDSALEAYYNKTGDRALCEHMHAVGQHKNMKKFAEIFSETFAGKIGFDLSFAMLLNSSYEKTLPLSEIKSFLLGIIKKEPLFLKDLSEFLKTEADFLKPQSRYWLLPMWTSYVKKTRYDLSGEEVFESIENYGFLDGEKSEIIKAHAVDLFSTPYAEEVLKKIYETNKNSARVLEVCEKIFEARGIGFKPEEIPMFEDNIRKVFIYTMNIQSNAIMQKTGVTLAQANSLIDFLEAYFQSGHSHLGIRLKTSSYKRSNDTSRPWDFEVSAIFPEYMDTVKEAIHNTLRIATGSFFQGERKRIITHGDNMEKNELIPFLYEYVKSALLHENIDNQLPMKEESKVTRKKI